MEFFGILAGLLLPWLLGVAWLRARWLHLAQINWPTLLGYGYLLGALATGLVMRLLDLMGVRLGFASISLVLCMLILVGAWAGGKPALHLKDMGSDWRSLSAWKKIAFGILLAIITVRFGGLILEIVWRPLFPWDAWSQWASKAKVWHELGRLVPFVSTEAWLTGPDPNAYTDSAPHYPAAIPLLQVWMAYSLGRWDDALINLPWLQCAVALGLAFYGQARSWDVSALPALVFTYFLLSLPILDTHVALAGYADLFMGTAYGMAAIAFFQWARTRDRWQGIAAILCAVSCVLIKQPGIVWMLTFVPALWVVLVPRAALASVAVLLVGGVIALLVLGEMGSFNLFGYPVQALRYTPVWESLWQSLFVLDNWHLLWYLVIATSAFVVHRLLSPAVMHMTVLLIAAFSFLGVVFFFTQAGAWADDFTTLNRALLHMVPMLLFYFAALSQMALKFLKSNIKSSAQKQLIKSTT